MSLILAIVSRRPTGNWFCRCVGALVALFLGWSTARAQPAKTNAPLPAVITRTTPGQRLTNTLLVDALRSHMSAPPVKALPPVNTNVAVQISTNAPPSTNTLAKTLVSTKASQPATNAPSVTTKAVTNAPVAKANATSNAPVAIANAATNTPASVAKPVLVAAAKAPPTTPSSFTAQPPANTPRFTDTVRLTNIVNLTNTLRIVDPPLHFTNTVRFTNTERFTNILIYTNTVRLTNTERFTNTLHSMTAQFFTNSEYVTNTMVLTNVVVVTNTAPSPEPSAAPANLPVAVSTNAPLVTTNSPAPLSAEVPSVSTNFTPAPARDAVASTTNGSQSAHLPSLTADFARQPSTNAPLVTTNLTARLPTNAAPVPELTTDVSQPGVNEPNLLLQLRSTLEDARHLRLMRQPQTAEPVLVGLLTDGNPEVIQQSALLELALVAQDESDLPRAQQIYAQFLGRWSNDRRAPEIFLHQGQLFRQMGLNSMALAKFYSVMTAAISVKNDQLSYYQRLVLDAQMEIAETHYQSGHFAEAADFFSRLLKQNNPAMNHPEIQFRLIRSLQASGNQTETAAQAFDFLARFPNSPNEPEVRFCLALALKDLGRNSESLQQVLALLKEQKAQSKDHPEVWAYWQQRTGNEIANQLFREGDYPKALDVYLSLEQLDRSASWQLPLRYQIGMTYERLLQPQMAIQSYSNIVSRETDLGTNATPGLKALVDMANWRINFIQWQSKADNVNKALSSPSLPEKTASKKPAPSRTAIP